MPKQNLTTYTANYARVRSGTVLPTISLELNEKGKYSISCPNCSKVKQISKAKVEFVSNGACIKYKCWNCNTQFYYTLKKLPLK